MRLPDELSQLSRVSHRPAKRAEISPFLICVAQASQIAQRQFFRPDLAKISKQRSSANFQFSGSAENGGMAGEGRPLRPLRAVRGRARLSSHLGFVRKPSCDEVQNFHDEAKEGNR